MKKFIQDFVVVENRQIHSLYSLLVLSPKNGEMPMMCPGQFVQVEVSGSKTTFLRRPISINRVDYEKGHLWLLVRKAGDGTKAICNLSVDDTINLLLPLGNQFTLPNQGERLLLVGGGVGVAPMLFWGEELRRRGFNPEFLLGARSASDILELEEFQRVGTVHISTDDGSLGQQGVVSLNTVLDTNIDRIYCCGPAPMMKAIAAKAQERGFDCVVSLENMMACGLGACLCCVEQTVKGNVCVCTEGPVFNIKQLTWQN